MNIPFSLPARAARLASLHCTLYIDSGAPHAPSPPVGGKPCGFVQSALPRFARLLCRAVGGFVLCTSPLAVFLPPAAAQQEAFASTDSADLELEGRLAELKDKAEAGDAYSMRQLYLRYAMVGKVPQSQAWAERFIAALEAKADAGDAKTARNLGILYMHGESSILPDPAKAVSWLTKASEGGDAAAAYLLGELMTQAGNADSARMSYARAYGLYKQQAEKGETAALYQQGYMEQQGLGTDRNAEQGIAHLQAAADAGCMPAVAQLFKTYEEGIGTAKDAARALTYAKRLADENKDARMAYLVADALFKGEVLPKDATAAEHYLDQAVAAALPEAQYHKAWMLEEAGKAPQALDLYRQAGTAGHANATIKAGTLLLYGKGGVERDEPAGLNCLTVAAERLQSPIAPYELGLYYDSIGESALADDWFITASDRGLADAMARRGWLHLTPFSAVSWNPTETYQWWKRGAEAGDADCRLYLNLYLYLFIPLIIILIIATPIAVLRYVMKEK